MAVSTFMIPEHIVASAVSELTRTSAVTELLLGASPVPSRTRRLTRALRRATTGRIHAWIHRDC